MRIRVIPGFKFRRAALAALLLASAGTAAPAWAQQGSATTTPAASPPATMASQPRNGIVEPGAIQALQRMASFLTGLGDFELRGDVVVNAIVGKELFVTSGGTATYRVRKGNGFFVDLRLDRQHRQYYYDGKTFTVVLPRQKVYASIPSPPTIAETVAMLERQYGIEIPLSDLFAWAQRGARSDTVKLASYVGPADVAGAGVDQFVYRTDELDWQLWLTREDAAVPRRIMLTTHTEQGTPTYMATLAWTTRPKIEAASFTFTPGADYMRINAARAAEDAQ